MPRRGLADQQLPQHQRAAEELIRGAAKPRSRKAAASQPEHRVGTLAKPYMRADGVATIKINVNLRADLVARLKTYTLQVQLAHGLPSNQWIEAALEHAIRTGFLPPKAEEP